MTRWLKASTALVAILAMTQPTLAFGPGGPAMWESRPDAGPDVAPYAFDHDRDDDHWDGHGRWHAHDEDDMIALLRKRVKYVFVIFNENHSFDNEYGTLPGVNGLYSDGRHPRSAAQTPGFTETYTDVNGGSVTVQPFRIGPDQNATVIDSVDHSHTGLATKLDVVGGTPRMDHFAVDEYLKYAKAGNPQSQAQGLQFSQLVMSHIDCDTIPFMWQYANRFTIFDNIFATEDTPSTPNAIAMIAGQSGETQWVEHGAAGTTGPISGTIHGTTYSGTATTQGPPIVNDPQPWWGSEFDATATNRQPTGPKEFYGSTNIASNLTFASVPLSLMGRQAGAITSHDLNPAFDLRDIQHDIPFIAAHHRDPVVWRWYQNGYDAEPTDAGGVATHTNYVTHHEGPQYFGYLANNPQERGNLRGLGDFFSDMAKGDMPRDGGVFYIRGGFYNLNYPTRVPPIQNPNYPNPAGLTPAELAAINVAKSGDDDHPAYADRQLSESMAARVINTIARNPAIWYQSAIIVTYDESDGFYDHVPPRILSYGPDGLPLSRGVRVPLILISPFARAHAVSHAEGDHNSVIETVNAIFNLTPLSQLPDEAKALKDGNSPAFNQFGPPGFQQKYLGPRDTNSPITDSLLSGFDEKRLRGVRVPLPPAYAAIPDAVVNHYPHYEGHGCRAIGVTPEDRRQGIPNLIPAHFNTLPSTLPAYN